MTSSSEVVTNSFFGCADSCSNTRIEDCFIVSGDDCVAVKSGWDEYGIAFGMPTKYLIIKNLTCISPDSAVIALGSEMSGGIQDVRGQRHFRERNDIADNEIYLLDDGRLWVSS